MNSEDRLRMDALEAIAKQDTNYQDLMQQMRQIEKKYHDVLKGLRGEDRDAVCEFVSQCEEISWYMLELARKYMRFP